MKRTCLTAMVIAVWGITSLGFSQEGRFRSVVFKKSLLESDTLGNFPGSVSFVQSSVMPSHHGVENDIQPHPISLRKTMVLFEPKDEVDKRSPIILTARDAKDEILFQGVMAAPHQLTKIAGQSDYFGTIAKPANFDQTIADNATLLRFDNDREGKFFRELLAGNNTLRIQTSDGNWTKEFSLPPGKVFSNKMVTFTSYAGYPSRVYYSNNSLVMRRDNEVTFKNVDGLWYSDADVALNKITYSDKAFSSILPGMVMKPGLKLSFRSGTKVGEISNLNIGAPNEMIIHTIDLGMLTPPRDGFSFQKDPELHRQYFQLVPISRLTVSEYEAQHLTEVMLPNGQLLTDYDPSEGGIYRGNMRQLIGKVLVSHGIDNANYGINSSGGEKEKWHFLSTLQLTVHNSVGKYKNGVQIHGMSGGNGMVTLFESLGNELSHEFGHNFAVGHYPSGFNGAVHRPSGQINSTWGWDGDKNLFIPNFEQLQSHKEQCFEGECAPAFEGHRFGYGAMSGGEPLFPMHSGYTLHTPYELANFQSFLEESALFSPNSPTGFAKWDKVSKQMSPWKNTVLNDTAMPVTSMVERKPYRQGVPVATIVGYYDPEKKLPGYIYPALHGSFGAVYGDNFMASPCKLTISTRSGGSKIFNLHSRRLDGGYMNKFHVNIEQSLQPYGATISCHGQTLASKELAEPKKKLKTNVIGLNEPLGCIVSTKTAEEYCLPPGQDSGYSLPKFIHNQPVYVRASEGTAVVLSDLDNLSYNHVATFTGTVPHDDLKKVKAANGKILDFSHPLSMRVIASKEPLGCIVNIETQEEYCLPVGRDSGYSLPKFIHNKGVYVKASKGTAVVLSDFDNLSYDHLATFTGKVSHFDLKKVKARNGEYLDFSHPLSMRVEKP